MAVEKFGSCEVVNFDGVECVIMKTMIGTQIAIPLAGFETFVNDARRRIQGLRAAGAKKAGNWLPAFPLPIQTMNVDALHPIEQQKAVLTFDRGLPTQISFGLPHEYVRPLAEELVRVAGELEQNRPFRN